MFIKVHRPEKNESGQIVRGSAYTAKISFDKDIEWGIAGKQ